MKKVIAFGIIFLLVIMSFTSISGIQIDKNIIKSSGRGNILYVGGSGEGNYTKIQDAVDNSSDGDTVFVYDDSSPYYQGVIVNKSINLIGENRDTTVIIHIRIESSGVNVSGFTFIRTLHNYGGLYADRDLSDIVISDNYFKDLIYDGMVFYADNSMIISNVFYNCGTSIVLEGSSIIISNNTVISNFSGWSGFEIWGGVHYVITNNTFLNLKGDCDIGISAEPLYDSIVKGNEFKGYETGIQGYSVSNTSISNNAFINNYCGIVIGIGSSFNMVTYNNFINNDWDTSTFIPTLTRTIFDNNYWDKWIGLKYPILSFLPYFDFFIFGSIIDWHPAKEPYDIPSTQGCVIE